MAVTGPWLASMFSAWLSGKTVKAMLVTSAYTQNVDSGTIPTANEVSGTGYTAGGIDVTSLISSSYDATTDTLRIHCDDVDFDVVDLPDVGGVVFYAGTQVIAADVFSPVDVSSRDFTYRPSADGFIAAVITP